MDEDNLEHSKPIFEYKPQLGGRGPMDAPVGARYDPVSSTYADLDVINGRLDAIQTLIRNMETSIDEALESYSLVVHEDDTPLINAQAVEWPHGDSPKDYITYKYYKYLKLRDTASARYIRKRYEDSLRDITGSNALDVIKIIELIKNEAYLARQFIDTYIGSMNDTAEFRSTELVQDWTGSALSQIEQVQAILTGGGKIDTIPESELESVAPEEARKAQALFKVKLNSINDEITQQLEILNRDWAQYADVFFGQYLGPALSFRLDANRAIYPANTKLGKEMYQASGALDTNLGVALTDYSRRNKIFDKKVDGLLSLVLIRDRYRTYINQLATIGSPVERGALGTTIDATDSPEEAQFFFEQLRNAELEETASNNFLSLHNALSGRDATDAHPQYLLRSGGIITGDIEVDDEVTIDGVDIDRHQHTGEDGSEKIDGRSITTGSLTPDLFDTGTTPETPENLRIISLTTRTLTSGEVLMDVVIAWEGDDDETVRYEVNISPIST